MFKKIAFLGVGLAMLSTPLLVFAQSTDQSEITALQAQVQQLLQQLEQLVGSGAASTTLAAVQNAIHNPSQWCPAITQTLSFGSTGSQVTSLQQFLQQQGDFSGTATGFFGVLTQNAVQEWQAQNGIVSTGTASTTGWGIFGTLSRGWLQKWCGSNGSGNTASFSATPTSGSAPLTVVFDSNAAGTLNFGDGTTGTLSLTASAVPFICTTSQCPGSSTPMYSVSHTYQSTGTYTATGLASCSGVACTGALLGSVAITVNTVQVGAVSVTSLSPSSGPVGTQVTITGSGFTATGNTVHFGGGGSLNLASSNGSTITYAIPTSVSGCDLAQGQDCGQWVSQVQPGNYSLYVSNANGTSNTESFTVTTGTATVGSSFSASPTSGTVPLAVTFTSNAAGTVNFGDGTSGTLAQNATPAYLCLAFPGSNCTNPLQSTYAISHTYQSVGTYTATLTGGACACPAGGVCNCPAQLVSGSITITVTGGSQSGGVTVSSLSPSSGPVGTQVTITGSGFTATGNTVKFASGGSENIASSNGGTTIVYSIPANAGPCSIETGEVCPLFLQVIQPGAYSISVSNANGTSNAEAFTVTSGSSIANSTLTASPTSGPAPLSVTFTSSVAGTVNFGDGTSGTLSENATPAILCGTQGGCVNPTQTYSVSHTYQSNGTYTAALENYACPAVEIFGGCGTSITITVATSGSQGGGTTTFSASPTAGAAPLSVTFTSSYTGTVNFGDGTSGTLVSTALPGFLCPPGSLSTYCGTSPQTYAVSHVYTSGGAYIATLTGYICSNYDTSPAGAACAQPTNTASIAPPSIAITVTGSGSLNTSFSTQLAPASTVNNNSGASSQSGTSCIATAVGGGAYPNGSTLESICNPSSSGCALGLLASNWMCVNGQWQQQGTNTATGNGTCTWGVSGKTFTNGTVIQACNPASSGAACPAGLIYPSNFTGYEMCSNGQWTPTPAPATQTNTSPTQSTAGANGSCIVQTNYCGSITVPNGSYAEDTHLCGVACQMQQCVNGTMVNASILASFSTYPGYTNLSCIAEPYSAQSSDNSSQLASAYAALESALQSLLNAL